MTEQIPCAHSSDLSTRCHRLRSLPQTRSTMSILKLANGAEVPLIGLGTWQAPPGEVEQAVKLAIDAGYRLFDCAHVYGNEKEIGSAVREKIAEGAVKREDLFIVSKLWNTSHRPELVVPACRKTLENFGLDYLDLYLMHWPFAFKVGNESFPKDSDGNFITEDIDYVDTYLAMEECVRRKLVKSIGLSNFNSQQILRVLEKATIKPVMNQVECHPYLNQKKLVQFCREHGMQVTGYSPLGAPNTVWAEGVPKLLDDQRLLKLADKHGRTVAQIVLRYLVQNGVIAIPKSTNPTRLKQNISVFDFELSKEDMASIDSMNANIRTCPFFQCKHDKNYPFAVEY